MKGTRLVAGLALAWAANCSPPAAAQSTLFTVTSPLEGQNVTAGGSVTLSVTPTAGSTVASIQVWSPIGGYLRQSGSAFTMAIPRDRLGPVNLRVVAIMTDGRGDYVDRTVNITTGATLNAITVSPALVSLVAPGTVPGLDRTPLTITGRYSDGVERDISRVATALVASDNTAVARVDSTGLVTSVAPGQASISVTIAPVIGSARVEVNVFELRGDLDGDGDVDQGDLAILQAGLGGPATGPGDPRDLNDDSRIDALDVQIFATLCSRGACTVVDSTPPLISPVLTGLLGTNGWYKDEVTVDWTVVDAESVISSAEGCVPSSLDEDSGGTTFTCVARNEAGLSSSQSVSVRMDRTPPDIYGMPATGCSVRPSGRGPIVVAKVRAADALSGLDAPSLTVTGSGDAPNPPVVVTPDGQGGYDVIIQAKRLQRGRTAKVFTLRVSAADLAGNRRQVTASCRVGGLLLSAPRSHSGATSPVPARPPTRPTLVRSAREPPSH